MEDFQKQQLKKKLNHYGIARGSVVFDIENDGDLDLLVVNQASVKDHFPQPTKTVLYRNDHTTGNWIKIKLQGGLSTTQGLGSRVEIVVNGKKQIREIDGGSSHLSQNTSIAHFGIGDASVIDSVIVKWLGGESQVLTTVKANQKLEIVQLEKMKGQNTSWPIYIVIILAVISGIVGGRISRRKKMMKKNVKPN
jgi:hypothetical protein